ncbi:MAG: DUF2235 domain-containing protein [Fimbriimonadaceae bacterium]
MATRNLVLCVDGTNDFAARYPTHVFRLFRALERSDQQLIYYDGGVGTLLQAKLLAKPLIAIYNAIDLAAGFSIRDNFIKAYEFLCDNYREGDQIYLFGFSRGAYTARAVAAAISYYGIPGPEHKNLIPFMWQRFQSCGEVEHDNPDAESPFASMANLKGALTEANSDRRKAKVHFLGVWDTVSSFGLINLKTLPGTSKLKNVVHVRHAVSIDEKRNMFPENLVNKDRDNVKEVWFAGVHRDVGGGGDKDKRGLSMCAYEWLLSEATGLRLDETKIDPKLVIKADPNGADNSSALMVLIYAIAGIIPMKMWSKDGFAWKWLNLWHTRPIPDGATIHWSVQERKNYNPSNLRRAKNLVYLEKPQ